jgi:RimJ/RimL family protein N-acetyltransferase/acyl carrier protein
MVMTKQLFYDRLNQVIPGGQRDEIKDPERRLYFTPLSMDGLAEMYQYSKDERLYQYFEFPPQKTMDETKQYLEKLFQRMGDSPMDRKAMYWFVRRIEDGRLVGTLSLVGIDFGRKSAEWGYGVDPDLWGMNYPLEMMSIAKKYAFEVLELNRVWGQTMITNQKTISVLMAAGCKHEGTLRDFYCKDGQFFDAWAYSILRRDYLQETRVPETASRQTIEAGTVAQVLSDVLGEKIVDFDLDMEHFHSWDSVTHFDIVVALQDRFSCNFSSEEIVNLRSVKRIKEILEHKL